MPLCEGYQRGYLGLDAGSPYIELYRPPGCTVRTKHRGDTYCPPCNLRLRKEGIPVLGSVITKVEWDRTWTTDGDREGEGDDRKYSLYTYAEYVAKLGEPRYMSGRDDCPKCEAMIRGEMDREAEREARNRRVIEASTRRKDIYG